MKYIKISLMLSIAAWGLASGLGNLVDYEGGSSVITLVMSMQLLPDAPGQWRAINSPALAHIAFVFVWGAKFATAILCTYSALKMWQARNHEQDFNDAKTSGLIGAGISMMMLMFAFNVMSSSYFDTYLDHELGATSNLYSFIYFGFIALNSLYISQKD
ncbi:MAG: DUF2165 family protein [Pseudomonadales bacterium]